MCLMNCHLAHGKSSTQKRFEEIRTIFNTYLTEAREKMAADHEIKFFFGDLNFRIEMSNESTCLFAQQEEYDELLKHDQLLTQHGQYSFLPRLYEAPIRFPPTYKFAKNTSYYDFEKRPPAWCDRILWCAENCVKCTQYTSVNSICFSDHKPVYGTYIVKIKQLVAVKRKPKPPVIKPQPEEAKFRVDFEPEFELDDTPLVLNKQPEQPKEPEKQPIISCDIIGLYGI